MKKALIMMILAGFAAPLMVGCEKNEGPLEEAGEKVDEAAKDAGRAVKDATD
jgi:hypothetical protein